MAERSLQTSEIKTGDNEEPKEPTGNTGSPVRDYLNKLPAWDGVPRLTELNTIPKSDLLRAFLATTDSYRPPYGPCRVSRVVPEHENET
jgi:hypothetical protein